MHSSAASCTQVLYSSSTTTITTVKHSGHSLSLKLQAGMRTPSSPPLSLSPNSNDTRSQADGVPPPPGLTRKRPSLLSFPPLPEARPKGHPADRTCRTFTDSPPPSKIQRRCKRKLSFTRWSQSLIQDTDHRKKHNIPLIPSRLNPVYQKNPEYWNDVAGVLRQAKQLPEIFTRLVGSQRMRSSCDSRKCGSSDQTQSLRRQQQCSRCIKDTDCLWKSTLLLSLRKQKEDCGIIDDDDDDYDVGCSSTSEKSSSAYSGIVSIVDWNDFSFEYSAERPSAPTGTLQDELQATYPFDEHNTPYTLYDSASSKGPIDKEFFDKDLFIPPAFAFGNHDLLNCRSSSMIIEPHSLDAYSGIESW